MPQYVHISLSRAYTTCLISFGILSLRLRWDTSQGLRSLQDRQPLRIDHDSTILGTLLLRFLHLRWNAWLVAHTQPR